MNTKDIVSQNLKLLRAKSQLSQEEFAKKAGMMQRAYGRLENGENWQHLESLERISKAYGVEVWQLLTAGMKIDRHPLDDYKNNFDNADENHQAMLLLILERINSVKDGNELLDTKKFASQK